MTGAALTILGYLAILAGGLFAAGYDAFGSRTRAVGWGIAALALSGLAFGWAAASPVQTLWGAVRAGGAPATTAAAIALLAAASLAGGWRELADRDWGGTLASLVVFGAGASILAEQTKDITLLLIALETAAACGYALVASGRQAGSREAAFKYFVQGAVATGFFLFGMSILVAAYVPTGDLDALPGALVGGTALSAAMAAFVLVIGGLAFKTGAAPFHSWAPDAYESSQPYAAAFLASGPKIAALTALATLAALLAGGVGTQSLTVVIAVVAVASILIGSVVALRQQSYTRMLGYAGVAQVGYALVAVAMGHRAALAVFFIVTYAVASAGAFLAAAAFRAVRPSWDGTIGSLAGIGRQAPVLAAATSVLMISLAGIPPVVGFWGKFVAFVAAFMSGATAFGDGRTLVGWTSVVAGGVGVLGSVVSLGYYGSVLRALYLTPPDADATGVLREPASGTDEASPVPLSGAAGRDATLVGTVVTLALVVIALGIAPLWIGLASLLNLFG